MREMELWRDKVRRPHSLNISTAVFHGYARNDRLLTWISPELDPAPDSRPHSDLCEEALISTRILWVLTAPLADRLDGTIYPRMPRN